MTSFAPARLRGIIEILSNLLAAALFAFLLDNLRVSLDEKILCFLCENLFLMEAHRIEFYSFGGPSLNTIFLFARGPHSSWLQSSSIIVWGFSSCCCVKVLIDFFRLLSSFFFKLLCHNSCNFVLCLPSFDVRTHKKRKKVLKCVKNMIICALEALFAASFFATFHPSMTRKRN